VFNFGDAGSFFSTGFVLRNLSIPFIATGTLPRTPVSAIGAGTEACAVGLHRSLRFENLGCRCLDDKAVVHT
jgi:hypothetical protein